MRDHFYVWYPAVTSYSLCIFELCPWDYLYNIYHSNILIFPELFLIFTFKNVTFHISWIWKWYQPQGRECCIVELSTLGVNQRSSLYSLGYKTVTGTAYSCLSNPRVPPILSTHQLIFLEWRNREVQQAGCRNIWHCSWLAGPPWPPPLLLCFHSHWS